MLESLICQSGVWSSSSALKVILSDSRAGVGNYSVTVSSPKGAIVWAGASSRRVGGDVYAYVSIDGGICARDRGSETQTYSTHNYWASASCSLAVPPGVYSIVVYGTIQSHITVAEL